jgi:hypothetical protein
MSGYSSGVLGEQEALVLDVQPFPLHGVTYYDVRIAYRDRSIDEARLGPEAVPEDLKVGEQVLAMRAANMVVSIRRPTPKS